MNSSLVVIHDFNFVSVALFPDKTDAVLIIDAIYCRQRRRKVVSIRRV